MERGEGDRHFFRMIVAPVNGDRLSDLRGFKERIAELRTLKSLAQADAERAVIALESVGVEIKPAKLRSFAGGARQRLCGPDGRYRRDHLRAPA